MLAKLDFIHLASMALGVVILYITYTIVCALLDPLRSIPGPFLARFTRFWLAYQIWKGEFQFVNIALHKQYANIVRIAPGNCSVDDLDGARVIYAHGGGFTKGSWYSAWTPNQDHPSCSQI
ncbi:hypothetical protein BGW36DRAFT_433342 [Talaromyces proteolyticus]|uniref:Uncharacterized protein n=1 Tax=Talaromyces proteolyticus TaxID=1131652 RepID=A0AAD4KFS2_9EURO|nr:uncharacterized protein BGW36DRAFT_433342 [Talaromyces proteolyticus]KAH8689336.1 hypothetical protein BGW36DRAFT_433342 [Talaromyces proteolyticus]